MLHCDKYHKLAVLCRTMVCRVRMYYELSKVAYNHRESLFQTLVFLLYSFLDIECDSY